MISLEKQKALANRLSALGIKDEDLLEKFILSSGKGGQKVNKTASAVYLKHIPSEIEVKCQKMRSRELNRYYARVRLCERLEKVLLGKKSKRERKEEKIQKQKKRRKRRSTTKDAECS